MLNTQPIEKRVKRPDGDLEVVDVWRTIQGEGPFAGTPAVFIRLAGCNLQCPLCDTDYTSRRTIYVVEEVVELVKNLALPERKKGRELVVITGGEPFRQGLAQFLWELNRWVECDIQIETNGTLAWEVFPWHLIHIVCSPKTPEVHTAIKLNARCFKYVIEGDHISDSDGLPESILGERCHVCRPPSWMGTGQIFVQPADEGDPDKNRFNLKKATEVCLKYGYRLSVQIHKELGLR